MQVYSTSLELVAYATQITADLLVDGVLLSRQRCEEIFRVQSKTQLDIHVK